MKINFLKVFKFIFKPKHLFLFFLIVIITLTVSGFIVYLELDRESEKLVLLKNYEPSVYFQDRNGEYLCDLENNKDLLGFWKIHEKIPKPVLYSVLSAEDKNFFLTDGVDNRALLRSAYINFITKRKASGASTIAMQVIRMQNPENRTIINKIKEILAARKLIKKYGYEKVLYQYLAITPFGNRFHGISFAAQKYFHKPLRDLTYAESAVLMSIPKSPNKYNLFYIDGCEKTFKRAKLIIRLLFKNKYISEYSMNKSLKELEFIPYFYKEFEPDYAKHAIIQIKKNKNLLNGYIVRTSLDLSLQQKISDMSNIYFESKKNSGAGNLSVIVADKMSGEILSYIGSVDYFNHDKKGSIDYCLVPRSSGSTLKPFLYALGMINKGYNGSTVLSDINMSFTTGNSIYEPQNYDYSYQGPVLYRYALANSRNIPAVEVLNEIGVQETYDFFIKLGLERSGKGARYYGLNLAIGGLYVRLFDLVKAYGILANDGRNYRLTWKINNNKKKQIELIPSDIARMITLYLSDPEARLPAFPRMGNLEYPFPVAVKTGTSQGYKDAWTVAYSEKYITGVWIGDPDNNKMNIATGGTIAAALVKKIMYEVHPEEADGFKNYRFDPPDGYIPKQVCKITGKLAGENTLESITEWFKPGTEPSEISDVFQETAKTRILTELIDENNMKQKKYFVNIDPKYANWALENNIEITPVKMNEMLGSITPRDINAYQLTITEPVSNIKYFINPTINIDLQTIALKVTVNPSVDQVLWYVDGKPFQVADYPYTVRWQLQKGIHSFQVKFLYSNFESNKIIVIVE